MDETKESDSEEGSCGLIANVVCSSERRDDVTLVTLTFTQRRYSNLCSFLTMTRILNFSAADWNMSLEISL